MKVNISQSQLIKSLTICQKVVKGNLQLPILSNVLLEINKDIMYLKSTNLNSGVVVKNKIKNQNKDEQLDGVAISINQFLEYLQTLKNNDLELEFNKERVVIKQQESKATLPLIDGKDYPGFKINKPKETIALSKEAIEKSLKKALLAVASDDSRPLLTGVLMTKKNGKMVLVGTDGYRLSLVETKEVGLKKDVVIPSQLFFSMVKDFNKEVEIGFDGEQNQVWLRSGEIEAGIRLLQGDFPDYQKILPSQQSTKITCDKEDLLDAVRQMAVFARQSANVIKWQVGNKKIRLYTHGGMGGEGEVEIGVKKEGENLDIAFNFRYLLEYLNNIDDGQIELLFNGQLAPVKFIATQENSFIHIIMPVKMD